MVNPTCEEQGYTEYTCSYCKGSYIADEVPMLTHDLTVKTFKGDCTQGSYNLYSCSNCDYTYKSDEVYPKEHTFGEWLVRIPADEGHAGIKYRICIDCSFEETAAIPVTDHTHTVGDWYMEKEATCDEYGIKAQKCEQCGEIINTEEIKPTGHDYVSDETKVTCTENGYTVNTCSKCGDTYQSDVVTASGHIESDWNIDSEETCTTDGKRSKHCTVCNEKITEETIEATGHVNCVWIVIEEATCTVIGSRESKCLACGEIVDKEIVAPLGHKYSAVTTEVSCTENGFTSYTCSVCSDHYDADIVEAEGHIEGEWEVMTEPTTTSDGLRVKYCTKCNRLLEEEIIPSLRIPVESIVIDQTSAEILCEQKIQLNVKIDPDNATNKKILWKSSDESVASVDDTGLVTALSAGKATITATSVDSGLNATLDLTVKSNEFKVSWIIDGNEIVKTVKYGEVIVKPADPIKDNFIFKGWTPEIPDTMPAKDLTFTAVFEEIVPTDVRIIKMPTKTEYTYKLDKTVDLSGIELEISYSDGTKKNISDTSKMNASGYVSNKRGEHTITVECDNITTTYKVEVKYTWWQWIVKIVFFGWIWY